MSLFKDEFHEGDSSDEFATPRWFWQPINDAVGGFDLDAASGAEGDQLASTAYTKEDDALKQDWFGTVWLNPPFSQKSEFLKKAWTEYRDGNTDLTVVLLPVDTSTRWFHNYVAKAEVVMFQKGRLQFSGNAADRNPNFGIMLVVFGEPPRELLEYFESQGLVIEQSQQFQSTEQKELKS